MNSQKRTEIAGLTIVKKLLNQSGGFDDTVKFDWQPMELFENKRCPGVSVTVCGNPTECVLSIVQLKLCSLLKRGLQYPPRQ